MMTHHEPRIPYYAANWRPFRTWACVLLRVAGDRVGLPAGDRTRGH